MNFLDFVVAQEDAHDFVAELDCLFLASYDVEQFRLLLLVLLSEVVDFGFGGFVLGPELLHDAAHALHLLLQRRVVALHEEHLLLLLPLFLLQRQLNLLLLLQGLLEHPLFPDLFLVLLAEIVHSMATMHELLFHLLNEFAQLLLLFLFVLESLFFAHQLVLENLILLSMLFLLLDYFFVLLLQFLQILQLHTILLGFGCRLVFFVAGVNLLF